MWTAKNVLLPLAAVALFVILVGIMTRYAQNTPRLFRIKSPSTNKTLIQINDIDVYVDIADNPTKWQLGLSGRESLPGNEGMLFVFDTKSTPSFWMKDMNFPIDIIWINGNEIIQIDQNVKNPDPGDSTNDLSIYRPFIPVNFVLEVNAGFVEKHNIAVRDQITFAEGGVKIEGAFPDCPLTVVNGKVVHICITPAL